jgi:L-fuculose-phosphate aldolase
MNSNSRSDKDSPSAIVADAMRFVYDSRLTTPSGGNISLRDPDGRVWVTPTLLDKGSLHPQDIVCINPDGSFCGSQNPTSEYPFHLAIYKQRPGVRAVVHNHSPALVACSLTGYIPDPGFLPLLTADIGAVVNAPYAIPGSDELADLVSKAFSTGASAILMANHGIISIGHSMAQALNRMSRLEILANTLTSAATFDCLETLRRPKELVAGHWLLATGLGLPGQIPLTIDKQPETRNQQPVTSDAPQAQTSNQQPAASNYFLRSILRGLNPYGLGSWSQRTSGNNFDFICSADVISPLLHEPPAEWEYRLHEAIYRHQPWINTIAIAYPPSLIAWSLLSQDFSPRTIPESYILLRDAITISLETFLNDEASLTGAISPSSPVALIQNGFFLCTGDNPFQVLDRLEVAENTAASLLLAKPLGPVNSMDDGIIQELKRKYLE